MGKWCNERQQERLELDGHTAEIDDGMLPYAGKIADVSMNGIRLNDLPSTFAVVGKTYVVNIIDNAGTSCFTLKASPCWEDEDDLLAGAGFKIIEASAGWRTFVRKINMQVRNQHGSNA